MYTLTQLVEKLDSLNISSNRQRYFFDVLRNYCMANGEKSMADVRPTARLVILQALRETVARMGHDVDSVIDQALDATVNRPRKRKGQPAPMVTLEPVQATTQPLWSQLYGDDNGEDEPDNTRWTSSVDVMDADQADYEVYLEQLELLPPDAQERAIGGVVDWLRQKGWSVDTPGWCVELVAAVSNETEGDPVDTLDGLFDAAEQPPTPSQVQEQAYQASLQEQIDELRAEVTSLRETLFDLMHKE